MKIIILTAMSLLIPTSAVANAAPQFRQISPYGAVRVEKPAAPISPPAPCARWMGWDADHGRNICGDPIKYLTPAEVERFKADWRPVALLVAKKYHYAGCGAVDWSWAGREDDLSAWAMMQDKRYNRMTNKTQMQVTDWWNHLTYVAANFSRKC